jgi:hypothetical protein
MMRLWSAPAICLIPFIAGCATFMGDTGQPIELITTCQGSTAVLSSQCSLSNRHGTQTVMTPTMIEVPRAAGDLTIHCATPEAQGSATLNATGNWNTAGNILLGGAVGIVVDLASGAGFKYPKSITISMQCDAQRHSAE